MMVPKSRFRMNKFAALLKYFQQRGKCLRWLTASVKAGEIPINLFSMAAAEKKIP